MENILAIIELKTDLWYDKGFVNGSKHKALVSSNGKTATMFYEEGGSYYRYNIDRYSPDDDSVFVIIEDFGSQTAKQDAPIMQPLETKPQSIHDFFGQKIKTIEFYND